MNTLLVWILVSASYGPHNFGKITVIGHFKTQASCEHVQKSLPLKSELSARCIQAEIVK